MRTFRTLTAVAALAGALTIGTAASAAIVTIQTRFDGGAFATDATGTNAAVFNGAIGTFNLNLITGAVNDVPLLQTTINDQQPAGSGNHTLDIFVTAQGYTSPLGALAFLSTFNTNFLTAAQGAFPAWTLADTTWISQGDLLPSAVSYDGITLSSVTMSGNGGLLQSALGQTGASTGAGPYALTAEYFITAHDNGSVLSTTAIAAVPEPATWAFMIVGFGGLGAIARRRRQQLATA